MKKLIAIVFISCLFAACSPQNTPTDMPAVSENISSVGAASGEAPAVPTPDTDTASSKSEPAKRPAILPGDLSDKTADTSSTNSEPISQEQRKVDSVLTITYGESWADFSQTLAVDKNTSYEGDANTITVERRTANGHWERVRDEATGNFTLEGKLTVRGTLPHQVLADALEGTQYRITTSLDSGKGSIIAQNTFLAGNTFDDKISPPIPPSDKTLEVSMRLSSKEDRTVMFTQNITNRSSQTISIDPAFSLMEQNANGLWTAVASPNNLSGKDSAAPLLLPGASFTQQGSLPLSMDAVKRGKYRLTRIATVVSPLSNQAGRFDFTADLTADAQTASSAPEVQETSAGISAVSLVLEQTSHAAGEATVTAYVKNMSSKHIVASKVRVYNVKDGSELSVGEAPAVFVTISSGETAIVLSNAFVLQPGEYAVEVALREEDGKEQTALSKNFTVESKGVRGAASAATVDMKVVMGIVEEGLLPFTQTFTNNSSQTLLVSQAFRVEVQAGGLWTQSEYPTGQAPSFPEDLVLLYPGESVAMEGVLPFLNDAPTQSYRITRTIKISNPMPNQEKGLTLVYTVSKKNNSSVGSHRN